MTKQVVDLSRERRKRKPRSLAAAAKQAARRFLDPKLDVGEEPCGLASGKADKDTGFVTEDEDEDEQDEKAKD